MPKIECYQPGKIVVDGKTYNRDIMVLTDGTVKNRNDVHLEFVYHTVRQSEINELFKDYPEVIVVGTGEKEKLKLSFRIERFIAEMKADLVALPTLKAVEQYNRLVNEGKKAAALFHLAD